MILPMSCSLSATKVHSKLRIEAIHLVVALLILFLIPLEEYDSNLTLRYVCYNQIKHVIAVPL